MSFALKQPHLQEIIKNYFSKNISPNNHKFASLHYAVWSGGTFLFVPK
jgi:Fe-S cluster assembly protein SufB